MTRRAKIISVLVAICLTELVTLLVWRANRPDTAMAENDPQLEVLRRHLDDERGQGGVIRIRDDSFVNRLTCTIPPFVQPERVLRERGIEPKVTGSDYADSVTYFLRVNEDQTLVRGFASAAMPFEETNCVEGRFLFRLADCRSPALELLASTCATLVKE
jgi:hypothetical protein